MDVLSLGLTSLFLGLIHGFDTDHVVAVTGFVSRMDNFRRSMLMGLRFGLGHSLTILVFGVLALAFKMLIPPQLGQFMEFVAGFVLVWLGAWVIAGGYRRRLSEAHAVSEHSHGHSIDAKEMSVPVDHAHRHRHPHAVHLHEHNHEEGGRNKVGVRRQEKAGARHRHLHCHEEMEHAHGYRHGCRRGAAHGYAPVLMGAVTGMAGTAAVMLFGPVVMAPSFPVAVLFIFLYGLGVVASMSLYAFVLGRFYGLIGEAHRWSRRLMIGAGLVSIGVGILWIFNSGLVMA